MPVRMPRRLTILAIAAAAPALAWACTTASGPQAAQAGATPVRQCFFASQVRGWRAVDDDTVQVFVGARRVYQLEILATCPNIDWSQSIGIRSTGGGSWICRGGGAELYVPSGIGLNRCPVLDVRQLTDAEAEAARAAR